VPYGIKTSSNARFFPKKTRFFLTLAFQNKLYVRIFPIVARFFLTLWGCVSHTFALRGVSRKSLIPRVGNTIKNVQL